MARKRNQSLLTFKLSRKTSCACKRDYEKARIDPKQAMIKKEELAKDAAELAKQKATEALDDIKKGESALEKMEKAELEKAGLKDVNMSDVHMDQGEFDQKMKDAEQKGR